LPLGLYRRTLSLDLVAGASLWTVPLNAVIQDASHLHSVLTVSNDGLVGYGGRRVECIRTQLHLNAKSKIPLVGY
jgi:hypothetical protein